MVFKGKEFLNSPSKFPNLDIDSLLTTYSYSSFDIRKVIEFLSKTLFESKILFHKRLANQKGTATAVL